MSDQASTPEVDAMCRPMPGLIWANDARRLERERDAYKKAKQENDERFMLERDEARAEAARLRELLTEAQPFCEHHHAIEAMRAALRAVTDPPKPKKNGAQP